MVSQRSTDSEDASPRKEEDHSGDVPSKKAKCDYYDIIKDYYAIFECNHCGRYFCPYCETGRNIVAGCDRRFFNWFCCQPCKYTRKEEEKKQRAKCKGKRKMPEPEPSPSPQISSSKGLDGGADAQCPRTDYDSNLGSSNKGPECCVIRCHSDENKTESDSYGVESELE